MKEIPTLSYEYKIPAVVFILHFKKAYRFIFTTKLLRAIIMKFVKITIENTNSRRICNNWNRTRRVLEKINIMYKSHEVICYANNNNGNNNSEEIVKKLLEVTAVSRGGKLGVLTLWKSLFTYELF